MIRKLIRRVFGKPEPASGGLRKIPRDVHGIEPEQISSGARKVTTRLKEAGHAAFVVGGAVRDLALAAAPKDFDVATDATPEEVHALFRRSRIIGRRFRLVHVMAGQEIVEVSTFRGFNDGTAEEADHRSDGETGRVLRDNIFGSQEDDARRRDFTVNAMFYDPATGEVWDYHNGFADLQAGVLRMIGDPAKRYREDPVRMLRAVRFAAKLDFRIDPDTRAPIAELAPLLQHVPSSRLFDEMLKLLHSGHAQRAVHQLRAEGLHHGLLPLLDVILEQPLGERFMTLALKNTDERVQDGKPVSPGFLFATLLWHEVLAAWQSLQAEGMKPYPALNEAMEQVTRAQEAKLDIPRRFDVIMKEIWSLQPRFERRTGSHPFRLLEHPRFRAGYDFLLLRCESGEIDGELGQWWTTFQEASDEERRQMLVPGSGPKKRRRRSRRRPEEGTVEDASPADAADQPAPNA